VLIAELRAGAAGAILDVAHLHDLDRIVPRDLDGAVGRRAVRQDDLAADFVDRDQRTLDCGRDVSFLVQRLDHDADQGPVVVQHFRRASTRQKFRIAASAATQNETAIDRGVSKFDLSVCARMTRYKRN
jgi:hypothetical protein